MKKILLCAITIFTLGMNVHAQDSKVAVGLGPEWNMNSREKFAGGAVLGLGFNFLQSFSAGLNFTASHNFNGITVLEPAAFFRWYFLRKESFNLFVQADAGAYLILEEGELTPLFDGGLRVGIRIPLGKRFYVEPYGRGGYPFVFGVGVMAGVRF
jgi:hypothetical protein